MLNLQYWQNGRDLKVLLNRRFVANVWCAVSGFQSQFEGRITRIYKKNSAGLQRQTNAAPIINEMDIQYFFHFVM